MAANRAALVTGRGLPIAPAHQPGPVILTELADVHLPTTTTAQSVRPYTTVLAMAVARAVLATGRGRNLAPIRILGRLIPNECAGASQLRSSRMGI